MNPYDDTPLEGLLSDRHSRRDFFKACGLIFSISVVGSTILSRIAWAIEKDLAAGKSKFPETIAALKSAFEMEMEAHYHYLRFTEKAEDESHPKIAYLFTALAASEMTHATKFKAILAGFEIDAREPVPSVKLSTTKANLRHAAAHELKFIDSIYPDFLSRMKPEKNEDAIRNVIYAWESHKQHRGHIKKIYRWAGLFFDSVARKFDESDVLYFVCRICGSTVTELPPETCIICSSPVSNYNEIEWG